MSAALVYILLVKAIASSFAGMGSLPQIQHDFVETRHVVSPEELSQAVLLGRSTPGPVKIYCIHPPIVYAPKRPVHMRQNMPPLPAHCLDCKMKACAVFPDKLVPSQMPLIR